jgi:hypothetical protein
LLLRNRNLFTAAAAALLPLPPLFSVCCSNAHQRAF